MRTTTDVLVVGAGPAGSFLAWLLARRGLEVTLIDRADFPREKVCGGGLSQKTLALLPFDLGPVISRRIRGAFLTYGNSDTVVADLDGPAGGAVLRAAFDAFLLRQAAAVGARFVPQTAFLSATLDRTGATVSTSAATFRTRFVVGADGVFSQVRRALFGRGLVQYVAAVEALVRVPAGTLARLGNRVLFDFGAMPRGYAWIFPKGDHLNVGVFSIFPLRNPRQQLARFMERYAVLREPADVTHLGFAIPVRNTRGEFARDRALLVGDAGGFAEPFYGEGIYYALRSAEAAAEAIAAAPDGEAAARYTRLVARDLLPDLRYANLNARLFYACQRFGFYRMVRNASVNSTFAGLISGKVTPRRCFYRTAATMPYWLFSPHLAPYEGGAL